jgi:hypothetical protein
MDTETKNSLKDLMFGIMFLAMFLIFLSYVKEFEDRITRLENMNETLLRTRRETPNYYEYLKGWNKVDLKINEIVPE